MHRYRSDFQLSADFADCYSVAAAIAVLPDLRGAGHDTHTASSNNLCGGGAPNSDGELSANTQREALETEGVGSVAIFDGAYRHECGCGSVFPKHLSSGIVILRRKQLRLYF